MKIIRLRTSTTKRTEIKIAAERGTLFLSSFLHIGYTMRAISKPYENGIKKPFNMISKLMTSTIKKRG
jgi:hypothetical protein